MLARIVGRQKHQLWKIGYRSCGNHLIQHNDPPRSQAPDIFEEEEEDLPDRFNVDQEKIDAKLQRLQKYPPPKIIVTNDNYDIPSFFLRSIDRVRTWYFGAIDVVTNH